MDNESQFEDNTKGVSELLKEAASAIKNHRFDDAEDHCVQALGILDKAGGGEHASKAMALELMGDALTGLERYSDAASFYKRALDLAETVFGQENQVYISIVYKLAQTYQSLSLLDECEPFFKSADELAKRHLAPEHPLRETIAEAYAHLISRSKKRRDKVVEIMGTFRDPEKRSTVERDMVELVEPEQSGIAESAKPAERSGPPAYKDLREKSTLYEVSAEKMQIWVTAIFLLIVASLLFYGYHNMQGRKASDKQSSKTTAMSTESSSAESTPASTSSDSNLSDSTASQTSDDSNSTGSSDRSTNSKSAEFSKIFSSLDGKRKLKIGKSGEGIVEFGSNKIDALIFQGKDTLKADNVPGFEKPIQISYVENANAITDDDGNVLYSDDSPERKTQTAMQAIAKSMRNAYLLRGGFPQNLEEMNQSQISYINPVTGKKETPIIQAFRGDQGWNPNNPEEKSTFESSFECGNPWNNEPPYAPGSIHIFVLATMPSTEETSSSRAPVAIIKAADRAGSPLRLDRGKTYQIVLTPNNQRSSSAASAFPVQPEGSTGAVVTIRSNTRQ